MQTTRLYLPKNLVVGQTVSLGEKASQHLLRVLRAHIGDSVIVFNGEGGEYQSELVAISKKEAVVKILHFNDVNRESPLTIHLLQGISRGERMDYVIQKATELGVASITPLFTERTTVKLSDDRLEKRLQHWQSIAHSSSEQSGRCQIPQIKCAKTLMDCLGDYQEGARFICDPESTHSIHTDAQLENQVTLLIGPEGGFSEQEIQFATKNGFQSLSLGPRILRTETAPIVALTLLQARGGDF